MTSGAPVGCGALLLPVAGAAVERPAGTEPDPAALLVPPEDVVPEVAAPPRLPAPRTLDWFCPGVVPGKDPGCWAAVAVPWPPLAATTAWWLIRVPQAALSSATAVATPTRAGRRFDRRPGLPVRIGLPNVPVRRNLNL